MAPLRMIGDVSHFLVVARIKAKGKKHTHGSLAPARSQKAAEPIISAVRLQCYVLSPLGLFRVLG